LVIEIPGYEFLKAMYDLNWPLIALPGRKLKAEKFESMIQISNPASRDWSSIEDIGDKAETFVACHLLKAIEGWNDMGLGDFQLGYLRDKNQKEVDFIVVRDSKPWFLAEVKNADNTLSPSLKYFQEQIKAPFAFQIIVEADYIDADCFSSQNKPMIVPARTFLSQLL
jgi:predicted AAA+ superfamily ATPase